MKEEKVSQMLLYRAEYSVPKMRKDCPFLASAPRPHPHEFLLDKQQVRYTLMCSEIPPLVAELEKVWSRLSSRF